MALSQNTVLYLQDALTDVAAGNELANAINNRLVLSTNTFNRLVAALTNPAAAADFQAAMLGQYILTPTDIQFLISGFDCTRNPDMLADILANMPVSPNTFPLPPRNVTMPAGFTISPSYVGPSQQLLAALTLPAGSTFPNFGPGAYFIVSTAGNTNQYDVWYNVTGGTNTNPAPIGFTGIEVTIGASDSAATVATKTNTALAALAAASTSVTGAVVTIAPTTVPSAAVAIPTFTPSAGTYGSTQTVAISSVTPGTSIYYTTDGSTPSTSSTAYSTPITVSASQQVKAIAVKTGFANSTIGTAAFIIGGSTVATPTFSPVAGTYSGTQSVTVSSLTAGAAFYYTLNGSTPTTGSTLYTGPISVNQSETVKVLATHAGLTNSTVASAAYTITAIGPALPSLGAAATYRILSEAGISTTAGTAITGNIAVSPIAHTAITGFTYTPNLSATFGTATQVSGGVYTPDNLSPTPANLTTAVANMGTAYTNAQGLTSPTQLNPGSGALGGLTLTGGLYKLTVPTSIAGTLTLSGGPSDTWVFQMSSTFTMATSAQIVMSGGALASNVYWVAAGAITLGVSSSFSGIALSATSIAVQTSATVHGQLFAQTAVTLDDNAIGN